MSTWTLIKSPDGVVPGGADRFKEIWPRVPPLARTYLRHAARAWTDGVSVKFAINDRTVQYKLMQKTAGCGLCGRKT